LLVLHMTIGVERLATLFRCAGGVVKSQRKIIIVADEPGAEPREYSMPRGVHVNVRKASASAPASR
jgi:hypothetical protein